MSKIRILTSLHEDKVYIKNSLIKPIQIGTTIASKKFRGMLHDNIGENISEKRPFYCELTAQYWAWKNLDVDYIGFTQYRRYFNFSETMYFQNFSYVIEPELKRSLIKKYGWEPKTVRKCIEGYDLITTQILDMHTYKPTFFPTMKDQYCWLPHREKQHLDVLEDILIEKSPEFLKYMNKYFEGHYSCFYNMYIMKKDLFCEYCEWLFDILDEFFNRIEFDYTNAENLRTPGFMAERLFNIYNLYLLDKYPNLKRKELQCIIFKEVKSREGILKKYIRNGKKEIKK